MIKTQMTDIEKENMILEMAELIKENRQLKKETFKLCEQIEQLENRKESKQCINVEWMLFIFD